MDKIKVETKYLSKANKLNRASFHHSTIPLRLHGYLEINKDDRLPELSTPLATAYRIKNSSNYGLKPEDDSDQYALVHHFPALARLDALRSLQGKTVGCLSPIESCNITELDQEERIVFVLRQPQGKPISDISLEGLVQLLSTIHDLHSQGIIHGNINHETVYFDHNKNEVELNNLLHMPCGSLQIPLYEAGIRPCAHPYGKSDDDYIVDYHACGILLLYLFQQNSMIEYQAKEVALANAQHDSFAYIKSLLKVDEETVPGEMLELTKSLLSQDLHTCLSASENFIQKYRRPNQEELANPGSTWNSILSNYKKAKQLRRSRKNSSISVLNRNDTPPQHEIHIGKNVYRSPLEFSLRVAYDYDESMVSKITADMFGDIISLHPEDPTYVLYRPIIFGIVTMQEQLSEYINATYNLEEMSQISCSFLVGNTANRSNDYILLPKCKMFFSIRHVGNLIAYALHFNDTDILNTAVWMIDSGYVNYILSIAANNSSNRNLQGILISARKTVANVKSLIQDNEYSDNQADPVTDGETVAIASHAGQENDKDRDRDINYYYFYRTVSHRIYRGRTTNHKICFTLKEALEALDELLSGPESSLDTVALPMDFYDFLLVKIKQKEWPVPPHARVFSALAQNKYIILLGIIDFANKNMYNNGIQVSNIIRAIAKQLEPQLLKTLFGRHNRSSAKRILETVVQSGSAAHFIALLNNRSLSRDHIHHQRSVGAVQRISDIIASYDSYINNPYSINHHSQNITVLVSCAILVASIISLVFRM